MQVIDLAPEKQELLGLCLEDWSDDARQAGAAGMAAWGVGLPFWMRASWFRRHGYRRADRQGITVLMRKPFTDRVAFQEIDTSTREAVARWGCADAVLLDGRNLQKGPPPSYQAILKAIAKRVARL